MGSATMDGLWTHDNPLSGLNWIDSVDTQGQQQHSSQLSSSADDETLAQTGFGGDEAWDSAAQQQLDAWSHITFGELGAGADEDLSALSHDIKPLAASTSSTTATRGPNVRAGAGSTSQNMPANASSTQDPADPFLFPPGSSSGFSPSSAAIPIELPLATTSASSGSASIDSHASASRSSKGTSNKARKTTADSTASSSTASTPAPAGEGEQQLPPALAALAAGASAAQKRKIAQALAQGMDEDVIANQLAVEEDKRRRNTAASARFRMKKKQHEADLAQREKALRDKVDLLERDRASLQHENAWLRSLVSDKDALARGPPTQNGNLLAGLPTHQA